MNDRWQLRVSDGEKLVYEAELTGSAEIGRQQNASEKFPAHYRKKDGQRRVVIAPLDEIGISRTHVEVIPLADGQFRLRNCSSNLKMDVPGGTLKPGDSSKEIMRPVFKLGNKTIRILTLEDQKEEEDSVGSLPLATVAPGMDMPSGILPDHLLGWSNAFLGLLNSAAGSDDFYSKACKALVELVKLDHGRILLLKEGDWKERAVQHGPKSASHAAWQPSKRILSKVLQEKKTCWHVPRDGVAAAGVEVSTMGVEAVVAAPILNRLGEVIGALYGDRRVGGMQADPITLLEAKFAEVLAGGVAAGLARQEQERTTSEIRTQTEQLKRFFGPTLGVKLANHPELLEGRKTQVSLLMCDITGFSRISEKLGPERTWKWIVEVMDRLAQCVEDRGGVVVDFAGDGLLAMWNAPEEQKDHAIRACLCALEMFDCLPSLNKVWQQELQEPLHFSIGINTGDALVGNVGSESKKKYGPLGNTVNLTSRVQGATKFLKLPLLITDSTQELVDPHFHTRRLCQARVVNIAKPVTLFELKKSMDDDWLPLKTGYENALAEFTQGNLHEACRILGRLMRDNRSDGPSLVLLSRAVAYMVNESDPFDPVMTLSGK
jgi:adenylate cyclase